MLFGQVTDHERQLILAGERESDGWQQFPFHPFESPGLPAAGPNFYEYALASTIIHDDMPTAIKAQRYRARLAEVYWQAMYSDQFVLPVECEGSRVAVRVIPGHFWSFNSLGPQSPSRIHRPLVMVVGKMPGREEAAFGRNFCGPSGQLLYRTLASAGVSEEEISTWYICNVLRWMHASQNSSAIPTAWMKDCNFILRQELRILRPDYILCLGAEATKQICGDKATLQTMVGRTLDVTYPINFLGEDPQTHTAKVMAVVHPAHILRHPEQQTQFTTAINSFVANIHGNGSVSEAALRIRYVYKERELRTIVDRIIARPGIKKVAVDCEWHGEHPEEEGSYLRTVQFSADDNEAVVVVLRHKSGYQAFMANDACAIHQLGRLLDRPDVQIIGHFFGTDLHWLLHNGLDLRHRFVVPDDLAVLRTGEYAGGFDTSLAAHAYDEVTEYKLELLSSRLLGVPRWDIAVHDWLNTLRAEEKLKLRDIEGYGECPEEVLLPYSAKDAIYTRKLRDLFVGVPGSGNVGLLHRDRYGNDCWKAFQTSMRACRVFADMHIIGVNVDRQRIDSLTNAFEVKRTELLAKFRSDINWPQFNPRSSLQCAAFLFGDARIPEHRRRGKKILPDGAVCLQLNPVKTTGKSKPWARVQVDGDEDKYVPSTDKETCGILASIDSRARDLRDLRLIDQVLKSVFRPPLRNKDGTTVTKNGHNVYEDGIAAFICRDGHIRTFFSQHKETGRASSKRPPLQNLSQRRETDYKRILGDKYEHRIRSFITSNMDDTVGPLTVLIEADYQGAELFGMATQACDLTMIDHCLRATLPEDHPNYYDIHSNVAVRAFRLTCAPTKSGLKSIQRSDLRVAAKNVIFGGGYGRSAEAISRQAQEEGVDITEDQAAQIMAAIFEMYSGIPLLQEGLRARARTPGWVRNCFGRLRRGTYSADLQVQGELERQFLNFPFQSMVADAVSIAMHNLYADEARARIGYNVVLQIHDAVILEVPIQYIQEVYDVVLPRCMEQGVKFQACSFDGTPYSNSPEYNFTIDRKVMLRWGERMTEEQCQMYSIPVNFAG